MKVPGRFGLGGPIIGLILILFGIFFNMFGEKCPNFILRANPDAALSLARRVFEFLMENRKKNDRINKIAD